MENLLVVEIKHNLFYKFYLISAQFVIRLCLYNTNTTWCHLSFIPIGSDNLPTHVLLTLCYWKNFSCKFQIKCNFLNRSCLMVENIVIWIFAIGILYPKNDHLHLRQIIVCSKKSATYLKITASSWKYPFYSF